MNYSTHRINAQLLTMLGIRTDNIAAVDLRIRPRELPTAIIEQLIDHLDKTQQTSFHLVPLDQAEPTRPPLDLDAMCQQARAAVLTTVCAAAEKHQAEMKAFWDDFAERQRMQSQDFGQWISPPLSGRIWLQLKGMA